GIESIIVIIARCSAGNIVEFGFSVPGFHFNFGLIGQTQCEFFRRPECQAKGVSPGSNPAVVDGNIGPFSGNIGHGPVYGPVKIYTTYGNDRTPAYTQLIIDFKG